MENRRHVSKSLHSRNDSDRIPSLRRTGLIGTRALALCALILFAAPAAHGQDPDISDDFEQVSAPRIGVQMEPVPLQHRTGAAFLINWALSWTGRGLVEGRLEFTISDQRNVIAEIRSDPMVLDYQEHRFSTMVPALEASNPWAELLVHPRFVTKDKTYDLGEFTLRLPQRAERTLVVAMADVWGVQATPERAALESSLRLERFKPETATENVVTVLAHIRLDYLGEDPLEYLPFDLLVLDKDNFSRLRARQLNAISAWVDAGGSLLVIPGQSLSRTHLDFLNETFPADGGAPRLIAGDEGRILGFPPAGKRHIVKVRKGWGRAAVVLESEQSQDFSSSEWNELVWFLWKGREDLLPSIREQGEWPHNTLLKAETGRGDMYWQGLPTPTLSVQRINSGSWLMTYLVPQRVQMMPLGVMALVLALYIIVVGPGDYYILGLLRLRKFTWVAFPTVTLGFAFFTLWLSEGYMRTDDQLRSAVFLDVADDGRIARASRIELLITSTHGQIERPVSHALITPLSIGFGVDLWNTYNPNPIELNVQENVGPSRTRLYGTLPDRYSAVQVIRKWTPQLNRVTQISPDDYRVNFNWDSITAADLADRKLDSKCMQKLAAAFGNDVSAYVMHGDDVHHLGGRVFDIPAERALYPMQVNVSADQIPMPRSFFHALCASSGRGFFALVSQISPTGGDNLEDLAVFDTSDPRRWLLIVAVQRDKDLWFYRKEYVAEP